MTSYLDTQVVVWLYEGLVEKVSAAAAAALEESSLAVSPMVLLELEYLYEIKRILQPPLTILAKLQTKIGLQVRDDSFASVIQTALLETWTRDPFDRVIVAHARTDGQSPLLTSDGKIRDNYPQAIW